MKHHRLHKRALPAVAALIATLVAGPLVARAAANDAGHHGDHGISVTFHRAVDLTAPPAKLGTPDCTAGNECIVTVTGARGIYSGDLVGSAISASVFAPFILGAPGGGASIAVLTLTDSPCGAGILTLMLFGWGPGDPVTPGTGKWQIAPDAGTGDLVHVTGSGRVTIAPDLTFADYEGRIFCNS